MSEPGEEKVSETTAPIVSEPEPIPAPAPVPAPVVAAPTPAPVVAAAPVAAPSPRASASTTPAAAAAPTTSAAPVKPAEPILRIDTTSLDPYFFDNDLIPFYGLCCVIDSCFLRVPDCYGGHGSGSCLCVHNEFTCLKPGRNEEEYCIFNDQMTTCVKPKVCCKGAQHIFCLDRRCAFLDLETSALFDPKFPMLCNFFGLTLFYKWKFLPLCCKKWKEIQEASDAQDAELLIAKNAANSSAAAQAVPVPVPVDATPVANSIEKR